MPHLDGPRLFALRIVAGCDGHAHSYAHGAGEAVGQHHSKAVPQLQTTADNDGGQADALRELFWCTKMFSPGFQGVFVAQLFGGKAPAP